MEHFLLGDLVVVRDDDEVVPFDDERPPDTVLGGVPAKAVAQFRVADRRCLAGVAGGAAAETVGPQAGPGRDLRGHVPDRVTLGATSFDLWQLPEWHVAGQTVLHLVLVARGELLDKREAHRLLLGTLDVERDGVHVLPESMGTFGGEGLIQCAAQFRGHLTGLTVTVGHEAPRA
ncbi:hypothetical protein [Nocardioides marmotae]|uniref:hypothetical protein n=1 Tax=Nocardioides marmotae TaxID=2663857 RepID=UPI0012B5BFCC|nr:hypothetical protein [Nocardioides marmotae]MBC9732417.1 hypothetical protein [Nocardioides marmotae]MTB83537.1 hypothetical protein [Nocardioides marmotae]